MSDSPRSVQRRRKRDSTLQAVDLLNGLMGNIQNPPSRANRPGPATPHPSRRLTYAGKRDAADMNDGFGLFPRTVPPKPRYAHETEVVTPRRSLRFSEPVPGGSTRYESDQMLQPPGSPELEHESGDQSDEPGEEQSTKQAEDGFGDDTHVISPHTSTKTETEDYSLSDAEHDDEDDDISSQSDQEMLDGEDLASEVELFSNIDERTQPSIDRPSSSPSSSHETPGRKLKTQPVRNIAASAPISTELIENTSSEQWKDAPEQPANRRDSSRSDASSARRLPTIAVEITTATPLSSKASATGDHQMGGSLRDDKMRIPDQEVKDAGATQDEDPPYQPSEASSSSVPSPEPTSSEDDFQHHSAEASPQVSDPPRQSTKRRHSITSSQGTTGNREIQPGRQTTGVCQQANSRVVRKSPAEGTQHSHGANHDGAQHATEPAQDNFDERSHRPERPEDSAWFKEASELDGQRSNWNKLVQSMHPRNIASNVNLIDFDFESLKRELSSLIQVYKDIIENLASDTGPSDYDVRNCSASLDQVDKQGRRHLEEAYTLSTQGDGAKGGALVEVFDAQIISLLVRLVLVCFQAYSMDHRLFPEAYGHLQHAMRVLLRRCDQIRGLVRGHYVACRAVSPGLRLPLQRLLDSLENGRLQKRHQREDVEADRHAKAPKKSTPKGQSRPPNLTHQPRTWTKDEELALIEGLQQFQGPDRYRQICEFYQDGMGQRGEREVRKQSERLYYQMLPIIREMARTGEEQWDWGWLLNVVE
ncbi:hypothetical protein CBS147343_3015 [Aspergillus niger]|uniref:Uncharacterized protein n=1 Tax=Aspergillus niger TaxID=5061 RepID=A0A9W6EB21_ASPNG|nr:hypothetical protein CBS133816_756 [Aspergillus niger]KAI2856174.1 hypothetical protein CBS12448_7030 [Aspergillus niger]KAI2915315.1 hypothetical protein CBS147371_5871 [Aspergillus niger]KAI2930067.1 hypothetical protein CBS147320_3629 [Aspergillus niger]KAI2934765.1 hypothetical protein CBS147321_9186 [Aspergillus niger]